MKNFETDLPLFAHGVEELVNTVNFDTLSLRTSMMPISVGVRHRNIGSLNVDELITVVSLCPLPEHGWRPRTPKSRALSTHHLHCNFPHPMHLSESTWGSSITEAVKRQDLV